MAPHRKYIHLQAEYPTSSSLERSHLSIFTATFFRISDTWCKPRKNKSCGFEDRKKWLLDFPCSLFPAEVEADSPFSREIACATSDRSKDKENKPCQLQRAPTRQHISKKRVLCQPWCTNPFSAITSQNQNSTRTAQQTSSAQQTPALCRESDQGYHTEKPWILQSKFRNFRLSFSSTASVCAFHPLGSFSEM